MNDYNCILPKIIADANKLKYDEYITTTISQQLTFVMDFQRHASHSNDVRCAHVSQALLSSSVRMHAHVR